MIKKITIPVRDSSPQIWYSFLRDSNDMTPDNTEQLINVFDIVHNSLVIVFDNFNDKGVKAPSPLLKEYFKFRHNVFSSLYLMSCFNIRRPLGTDDVLTDFGLETNKTPDYVSLDNGNIRIREFSVTLTIASADYNKGGFFYNYKYKKEREGLEDLGFNVDYKNIIMSIKDIDMESLCSEISGEQSQTFRGKISKFRSICSFSMESFYSHHFDEGPGIKNFSMTKLADKVKNGILEESKNKWNSLMKTVSINPDIFLSNNEYNILIDDCIKKNDIELFLIRINPGNSKKYLIKNKKGLNKKQMFNILVMRDISVLVQFMFFDIDCLDSVISTKSSRLNKEILIPNKIDVFKFITEKNPGNKTMLLDNNYKRRGNIDHLNIRWGYCRLIPEYKDNYGPDQLIESIQPKTMNHYKFPLDYFSKLLDVNYSRIIYNDEKDENKMLCNNPTGIFSIKGIMDVFNDEYTESNSNYVRRYKQTFMYPMCSGQIIKSNNYRPVSEFMTAVSLHLPNNLFYKKILRLAIDGRYIKKSPDSTFNSSVDSFKRDYNENNSRVYIEIKRLYGLHGKVRVPKLAEAVKEHPGLLRYYQELNESRLKYINSLKNLSELSPSNTIRIGMKTGSENYKLFQTEMYHFERSKKGFSGVGDSMGLDELFKIFKSLSNDFFKNSSMCFHEDFEVDDHDHPFLKKMKNDYRDKYLQEEEDFSKTKIAQILFVIQKFCLSLFKSSTRSCNSDYFILDNLGFENVLLLVKGGKKIQSTQKSKLYRLLIPISEAVYNASGYRDNSDFDIMVIDGLRYVLTPWSQMREPVLLDGVTLAYRYRNHINSINIRCGNGSYTKMNNVLPLLLALSNRRKTEAFMHNMRYLIVNNLGEFSSIKGIIKSFAGFNYTMLDAFLRESIKYNYPQFCNQLIDFREDKSNSLISSLARVEINHFVTGDIICKIEELTTMVYSTYLMTKAPYEKNIEQGNNLLPVLEDVLSFKEFDGCDSNDDSLLRIDLLKVEKMPKTDFSYDPTFMQFLGFRTASRLNTRLGRAKVTTEWLKISSQNLIDIANPNGLRGFNKENFFGKKGYQVVAEYIRDRIDFEELNEKIAALDKGEVVEFDYYNKVFDILENIDFDKIIMKFHMVDKVQRGAGREIFVMDIMTKMLQNSIEKMFKFLCKGMDNEIISVPSDRRPELVHRTFFSGKKDLPDNMDLYNFVLDCKRWAPHSVLQKYIHFSYGMSKLLPESFTNQLMAYLDLMINKKVFITREYAIKTLGKNEKFTKLDINFLKRQYADDDWSFVVKFSFVMGIHNYMSSLVHAENQKLASDIIFFKGKLAGSTINLNMIAHSDDSAGQLMCGINDNVKQIVGCYEILLRMANHMLSIKKSVISKVYFEFLSTLYLKDRMLPVTTKFLCGLTYTPTDKGLGSDLSFAGSQCIELMQNGASMFEAYVAMKLAAKTVYVYYGITKPMNGVIYHLGGNFDPHPISLLLSGTDSEFIRLSKFNTNDMNKMMIVLDGLDLLEINSTGSFNVCWDMGHHRDLALIDKFPVVESKFMDSWILSNHKFKQFDLSLLWFVNKLKDPNFYSSITNSPNSAKISRLFGSFKNRNLKTNKGNLIKFEIIFNLLKDIETVESNGINKDLRTYIKILSLSNKNLHDLYDALPNSFETKPAKTKTIKPMLFTVRDLSLKYLNNIKPIDYTCFHKEPEYFRVLNKNKDTTRYMKSLDTLLENMDFSIKDLSPNELYKISNKILNGGVTSIRLVQPIKGERRFVNTFTGILDFLSDSSIPNKIIDFKRKNAADKDYSKLRESFGVPDLMGEVLTIKWLMDLADEYGVLNINIFNTDLHYEFNKLLKDLPHPWNLMFIDYVGYEMSDIPFWRCWTMIQTKIGNRYKGKGKLCFKVPEIEVEISLDDNKVVNLNIKDSKHRGILSDISSWYIKYFIEPQINLESEFINSESICDGRIYLGKTSSGHYSYDYSSDLDLILPNISTAATIGSDVFINVKLEKHGGNEFAGCTKLRVIGFREEDKFISIGKWLDMENLKHHMNKHNVSEFLRKVSKVEIPFEVDKNHLFLNFDSSVLYKIFFPAINRGSDKLITTMELFMEYKKKNPDFGFPTSQELIDLHGYNTGILTPDFVLEKIKSGDYEINTMTFKILEDFVIKSLKGDTDLFQTVFDLNNLMGSQSLGDVLTLKRKKNKDIIKNFKRINSEGLVLAMLNEFYSIMCLIMDKYNNMDSITLTHIQIDIEKRGHREYKSDLFKMIFTMLLYDILTRRGIDPSKMYSWELFYSIISELIGSGLINNIIHEQENYHLMSMIDFEGDENSVFEFFVDIFAEVKLLFSFPRSNAPFYINRHEAARGENAMDQFNSFPLLFLINPNKTFNKIVFKKGKEKHTSFNNWCGNGRAVFFKSGVPVDDDVYEDYKGPDMHETFNDLGDLLEGFNTGIDLSFLYYNDDNLDSMCYRRGYSDNVVMFCKSNCEVFEYEKINLSFIDTDDIIKDSNMNAMDLLIMKCTNILTTDDDFDCKYLTRTEAINKTEIVSYSSTIENDSGFMSRFDSARFKNVLAEDVLRIFEGNDTIDVQKMILYEGYGDPDREEILNTLESSMFKVISPNTGEDIIGESIDLDELNIVEKKSLRDIDFSSIDMSKIINDVLESNKNSRSIDDMNVGKTSSYHFENIDNMRDNLKELLSSNKGMDTNIITDSRLLSEESSMLPGLLDIIFKKENILSKTTKKWLIQSVNLLETQVSQSGNNNTRGLMASVKTLKYLLESSIGGSGSNGTFVDFISDTLEYVSSYLSEIPNMNWACPMPSETELKYNLR